MDVVHVETVGNTTRISISKQPTDTNFWPSPLGGPDVSGRVRLNVDWETWQDEEIDAVEYEGGDFEWPGFPEGDQPPEEGQWTIPEEDEDEDDEDEDEDDEDDEEGNEEEDEDEDEEKDEEDEDEEDDEEQK